MAQQPPIIENPGPYRTPVPQLPQSSPSTAPQTAYNALSDADKDAVNGVVLWGLADRAAKAARQASQGSAPDEVGVAYEVSFNALRNRRVTTSEPDATAVTEMDIEASREVFSENAVLMQRARETYALLQRTSAQRGITIGPGDMTRRAERMIAIDGDQISEAQVQAALPALRRQAEQLSGPAH